MGTLCALIILTSTPSISEVKAEIIRQAQVYNVSVERAISIADCESDFNPLAKNKNSSATGIYQFTSPTWKWIKAEGERTDYKANIKEFMRWYPKYPGWWRECDKE